MTAKTYYARLVECKDEESFTTTFNEIFQDLIKDAKDLITRRNAKREESIAACVNEVNQKYLAITRLHKSKKDSLPNDCFINQYLFDEDGFKAIFKHECPELAYTFDLKAQEKKIADHNKMEEERENRIKNFVPHKLIPFEELTMENIHGEFLDCAASLGGLAEIFGDQALTIGAPLAYRMALLRYWIGKGKIDLDDLKEYEKDPARWASEHC